MTVSKKILNFHVGKHNFMKGKSILYDSFGTDIKLKCQNGEHSILHKKQPLIYYGSETISSQVFLKNN